MIVEIEGELYNYLYLKTTHAEERQLERNISDEDIKKALRNRDDASLNHRGQWEYTSAVVRVIVIDDEQGHFDGIIVTVYRI